MLETINATQRRAILFTITLTTLAGYTAALTIPAPVSLLPIAYNLSGLTNTTLINSALSTDPPSGWPDPHSFHLDGYLTTTEFYDYRGPISANTCVTCIEKPWLEARRNAHHIDAPLGTALRSWSCRDRTAGYTLVLAPNEQMTWRMLKELWVGNYALCVEVGREFQFLVMAGGEEGGLVGIGQLARD